LQRSHYMHGLDGLRALAVALVVIYHLHYNWAPGGLLGVGIFFVLSGYLITDILLRQWKRHQRLDLRDFWIRRAKRLLPALFAMLIVVIVWSYFLNQEQIPIIRQDSLAAVLYVSNWWYIFHDVSYFESFGPSSPFEHLWSLAVEEQFYLLFPLILWLGMRWISRKKWLFAIFLGLAAISALLMAGLYRPGEDPSRVYFGTDTRAFALLIGSGLAILFPSHSHKVSYSTKQKRIMDALGTTSLLILLGFIFGVSEYNSFLFRGGLVFISIITATLIFVIAQPVSVLGKFFAWKPLKWLGERSYGIYLWHYPVIILSSSTSNIDGISWARIILQVIVTIGLAAASHRWIENPIRYGTISRPIVVKSSIAILTGILFLALPIPDRGMDSKAANEITTQQANKLQPEQSTGPILESRHSSEPIQDTLPSFEIEKGTTQAPVTQSASAAVKEATQATEAAPEPVTSAPKTETTPTPTTETKVTAIGDSVMIDIEPYLKQMIPDITVDGKVGRQLIQTPPEIERLKSEGNLGKVVVIQLGTNGPFTLDHLQTLYQSLNNPNNVIFVNTRVPRPWEADVNKMLAKFVEDTPNSTLVDWYSKSASQSNYFAPDGVHLTPEGSRVLAAMIQESIEQ
jgi:peptidoglycan/LPS O-acetylase OafA/YrhL